jgi:hypothetical protein
MGGHASMCPVLIVSIFLAPSRPETGELRMLPGSHECVAGLLRGHRSARAARGIGLAADAGDVTLHYGDIMHARAAADGAGPFRRCILLAFARARRVQPSRRDQLQRPCSCRARTATSEHLAASRRSRTETCAIRGDASDHESLPEYLAARRARSARSACASARSRASPASSPTEITLDHTTS